MKKYIINDIEKEINKYERYLNNLKEYKNAVQNKTTKLSHSNEFSDSMKLLKNSIEYKELSIKKFEKFFNNCITNPFTKKRDCLEIPKCSKK